MVATAVDGPEATSVSGAPAIHETDGPAVAYQQRRRAFCAGYSLASAVHAFGDEAGAAAIAVHAAEALRADDTLHSLLTEVNSKCVCCWQARWAKPFEKRILADGFVPPSQPMLLQLGTSHAVTLCGRWLFDSNFQKALPLSRASLDAVLERTCTGARFSHVSRAVVLSAGTSVKKHVGKKRRREQAEEGGDGGEGRAGSDGKR